MRFKRFFTTEGNEVYSNIKFKVTSSEIKNPGKNIPLSIIYCIIIVMTIYISINYVLVYTLGFEKMMSSNLVMSDAASIFLGNSGAAIVTIIILISLVGSNNGFIFKSYFEWFFFPFNNFFFTLIFW